MSLSNFLHENIHTTYAPLLYVPWLISTYKYTDLKGFIFLLFESFIYTHMYSDQPHPNSSSSMPTPTPHYFLL